MKTFRIDNDNEQAEALIYYLQSLPYVTFVEEENEPHFQEEENESFEEPDPEMDKALEKFDLGDIAGELDLGMQCHVHKTTGEVVSIPDDLDMYDDEEGLWQEMKDRVTENSDDYIVLSPLVSTESFEIMESFVEKVNSPKLRKQLADALTNRKPFRNFSTIINNSEVRQEWFDHKNQKEREYVREQLRNALKD